MPGGRVTLTAFNNTSKWSWFGADLNGSFYASVISFIIVMPLLAKFNLLGVLGGWSALVVYLPAFIVTFVFRRNMTVIGERRSFRYFCRWL